MTIKNSFTLFVLFTLPFLLKAQKQDNSAILNSCFSGKLHHSMVFLEGQLDIDLSKNASGIYFLFWSTNGNNGYFKLILETH